MKKTAAPSPEDDELGAKLDRIIELLEQQRGTYVFPYTPIYPRPYYPGFGPYWSVLPRVYSGTYTVTASTGGWLQQ